MASTSDAAAPARPPHLRLVDSPAELPSTRALIEEARSLDKLGRRAEARMLYEQALRSVTVPSPSLASMLLRWIARTYEVDADYEAAEDCAEIDARGGIVDGKLKRKMGPVMRAGEGGVSHIVEGHRRSSRAINTQTIDI